MRSRMSSVLVTVACASTLLLGNALPGHMYLLHTKDWGRTGLTCTCCFALSISRTTLAQYPGR
jgi:hypothetical protein